MENPELNLEIEQIIFEKSFFKDLLAYKVYKDKMRPLKFAWDGSDIGNIDENIYDCRGSEDDHVLTLWGINERGEPKLTQVKILKYKNEIPIIIDECKPLFGLKKVGKHKATLKGHTIILVRYQGDVSLRRYLKDMGIIKPEKAGVYFISEIRKLFIFKWFMCLNNNYVNTIEVRTGTAMNHPISCRENYFNYDASDPATRIPKSMVKMWFDNDEELVESMIKEFILDKDISVLRFEIQKIIMKFDKHLISWNNGIFDKFLYATKDSINNTFFIESE